MHTIHTKKYYIENYNPDECQIVAVYGTLMRGMGNHHLLNNEYVIFLGNGLTTEYFEMSANFVPFVNPNNPLSRIKVEVYLVHNDVLKNLDHLESHPDWYKREITQIEILPEDENNESYMIDAWLYFNTISQGSDVIEDGNYRKYITKKYK